MMKMKILLLSAVAAMQLGCAMAQEKTGPDSYIWYDGGKPKRVWMDSSVVAEFGKRAESASEPAARFNGVRIWRQEGQAASRALATGDASPVLRDSPGGPIRALPGNIIVGLDPAWTGPQISSWLSAHGLTELRRLSIGTNVLVIASPPGLPSLELANRLQESGTVVFAQPNWWTPTEQR
jgi:hypothetical protein